MASFLPRQRLLFVVVVGLSVAAVAGYARLNRTEEKVPWQTDLAAARREAVAGGKGVLIDFAATWCGPCEEMRHTTWADPGVAAAVAAKYVPVRIDVDQQPDVAKAYAVQAIPRMVVEDAGGHVRASTEGMLDATAFQDWLAAAPTTAR